MYERMPTVGPAADPSSPEWRCRRGLLLLLLLLLLGAVALLFGTAENLSLLATSRRNGAASSSSSAYRLESGGSPERATVAVHKTHTSDAVRFLFVAGLGGTGHHGWLQVLKGGGVCRRSRLAEDALRLLWYGPDDLVDQHTRQVELALAKTMAEATAALTTTALDTPTPHLYCLNLMGGSMLSYPDRNEPIHHPNILSLARIAERAEVDLRLLVLHRHPAPQLVSLSLHRSFLPLSSEAAQMANQAAILNGQLRSVDAAFFRCTAFDGFDAAAVARHLLGGTGGSDTSVAEGRFVDAVAAHYNASADEIPSALREIHDYEIKTGAGIATRVEEMVVYYDELRHHICPPSV